ncbi:MAG: helix-turn-helix domain-containing protein [Deltaproteobacteria bacterium]|nr:helix-turn-helix domain-containing protein [Deltaproteobacteria bacterium]
MRALSAVPKPVVLLKVGDVAARLGVCNATVYSWCSEGLLPHIRVVNVIRVTPEDLQAFLSGRRVPFDP